MDEPMQRQFMQQALTEGRKALPGCIPNPPVGCVLVREGKIVAAGHTQPPGQPHAEAMALAQLSGSLENVTAFVTLEPCSFHGRTPACARELIARGVRRVIVAMLDPDVRNAGAGIKLLRDAGVEVQLGILESQAREALGPYLARKDNVVTASAPPASADDDLDRSREAAHSRTQVAER
jgi:riboflavin biosynthesis protein RibD